MDDEIHKDPVKLLRKQYEAKALEIIEIERQGDVERLNKLREERDAIYRELQAADGAAELT